MIPVSTGGQVWLATGDADMRKGFPSLSPQVQEVLRRDPLGGHLICFRGRRGDRVKMIRHGSGRLFPADMRQGSMALKVVAEHDGGKT